MFRRKRQRFPVYTRNLFLTSSITVPTCTAGAVFVATANITTEGILGSAVPKALKKLVIDRLYFYTDHIVTTGQADDLVLYEGFYLAESTSGGLTTYTGTTIFSSNELSNASLINAWPQRIMTRRMGILPGVVSTTMQQQTPFWGQVQIPRAKRSLNPQDALTWHTEWESLLGHTGGLVVQSRLLGALTYHTVP